jgi:hypothetical protein
MLSKNFWAGNFRGARMIHSSEIFSIEVLVNNFLKTKSILENQNEFFSSRPKSIFADLRFS